MMNREWTTGLKTACILAGLAQDGSIVDHHGQVVFVHTFQLHVLEAQTRADPVHDDPWSVVVAHDGVFKVTLLALLDLPLARFWTLPFALCGISIVEIRNGRPRLRLHNATDHLADLQTTEARIRDDARRRSGAL